MSLFITDNAVIELAQGLLHIVPLELGAVRHVDGVLRDDARKRHGLDAFADLYPGDCNDRGAVGRHPQPADRDRRNLDCLSDHVLHTFVLQISFYGLVWRKREIKRLI
jgi:hypothetical protein